MTFIKFDNLSLSWKWIIFIWFITICISIYFISISKLQVKLVYSLLLSPSPNKTVVFLLINYLFFDLFPFVYNYTFSKEQLIFYYILWLLQEQLIAYYKYKPRRYKAITEDGFILPMTRIFNKPGPPVLFFSGLGVSKEIFLIHGPGHDLGIIIANILTSKTKFILIANKYFYKFYKLKLSILHLIKL